MKLFVLAGLFTIVAAPCAFANETAIDCGLDAHQVVREQTSVAIETTAEHVTPKAARSVREEETANAAPPAATVPTPAPVQQQTEQRRRGGSHHRVPDAMLIDGRGIL